MDSIAENTPKNRELSVSEYVVSPSVAYVYENAPKIKAVATTVFEDAKKSTPEPVKTAVKFATGYGLLGAILSNNSK